MGKKKAKTTTSVSSETQKQQEQEQQQEQAKREEKKMTKKRNPLTVSVSSEDVERKHPYLVFSLKAMAFVLAACVGVWSCWKA